MARKLSFKQALFVAGAALVFGAPTALAQDANFAKFEVAAETSGYNVEYKPLNDFMGAYSREERGRTKLAYASFGDTGTRFLRQYVGYLDGVPVTSLTRDEQLAYWLNTRNILIVQGMAEARNRRKVKAQRGTFAAPGDFWTTKRIEVQGEQLSIDDIERNIILANFADNPNVIYGLYQASDGGASMPNKAYTAATVDGQLEELGRKFINSSKGVKIRRSKVQIPEIYSWYSDAVFGGDQDALNAHLTGLMAAKTVEKFSKASQFESRSFGYSSDELVIRQQQQSASGAGGGGGGGGGGGS